MSERTGFANGSLKPVIYFENAAGVIILPPEEIGATGIARMCFDQRYKAQGWQWCEAGTLADVDRLQKRLAEQDLREAEKRVTLNSAIRERVFRDTGSNLRQRMCSSETTPWERDFIAAYLQLREEKRDKYRDALIHHNGYLWAREQDAGKKLEDLLPLQPGQFERNGV